MQGRWRLVLLLLLAGLIVGGCSAAEQPGVVKLVSVSVTPGNARIASGTTLQMKATGTYSDNSTRDLTGSVTWSTDLTSTAVIDAGGKVLAGLPGTVTIKATSAAISGSTILTVSNAVLSSIAVSPASVSFARGTSLPFTATGTFSDNTTQDITTSVVWESSLPYVASISNAADTVGIASAVTAGTTTISATMLGKSGSTTVTVTSAVLQSIAVTPLLASLPVGSTQQLVATGTFSDGSTQDLTRFAGWSSSASGIAGVGDTAGSKGLVSGISPGTATISASAGTILGTTVTGSTILTVIH